MNEGAYQKLRLVYQKPEIRAPTEVILSVFASLFLIMVAIRPTLVTVTELRKEIEDQTLVETKLDTKIKRLIQARNQLDENESILPLFERVVPDNYTYGNLAKKIEMVAAEEMVEIESLTFSSAVISSNDGGNDKSKDSGVEWVNGKNKVKEFKVRFGVTATEPALVSFLKKIENLDRVLTISMVDIALVKEKEISGDRLRASGEMSGYYLITTEEDQE